MPLKSAPSPQKDALERLFLTSSKPAVERLERPSKQNCSKTGVKKEG
jgi:hypothetical protein